jgi:hypothetical protein
MPKRLLIKAPPCRYRTVAVGRSVLTHTAGKPGGTAGSLPIVVLCIVTPDGSLAGRRATAASRRSRVTSSSVVAGSRFINSRKLRSANFAAKDVMIHLLPGVSLRPGGKPRQGCGRTAVAHSV